MWDSVSAIFEFRFLKIQKLETLAKIYEKGDFFRKTPFPKPDLTEVIFIQIEICFKISKFRQNRRGGVPINCFLFFV